MGGVDGQVGIVGQSSEGETWVRMKQIKDIPPSSMIEPSTEVQQESTRKSDKGTQIDIMVPYTSDALCLAAGLQFGCDTSGNEFGIEAYIDFFIAENNAVFYASNLEIEFRLVHTYMVSDYEEGDYG